MRCADYVCTCTYIECVVDHEKLLFIQKVIEISRKLIDSVYMYLMSPLTPS